MICTVYLCITFAVLLQSMAELLAENYHNIWARKKTMELEAKGNLTHFHLNILFLFFNTISFGAITL